VSGQLHNSIAFFLREGVDAIVGLGHLGPVTKIANWQFFVIVGAPDRPTRSHLVTHSRQRQASSL
jgi:hypothetical protein